MPAQQASAGACPWSPAASPPTRASSARGSPRGRGRRPRPSPGRAPDPGVDPRARRVGEQERDRGVSPRVLGLLRVAEAGGDVDRAAPLPVVGGDRPGDRLLARVDRRVLAGDEALEDVAHVLRQAARHGEILGLVAGLARVGRPGAHRPRRRPAAGSARRSRSGAAASASSELAKGSQGLQVLDRREDELDQAGLGPCSPGRSAARYQPASSSRLRRAWAASGRGASAT